LTLQKQLNYEASLHDWWGWFIAEDGDFGPQTLAAVKHWQQFAQITVDGVVGPQTWHSLGYC
jgi:peptidoglycan hydrolase-like protein with peptidoglycan-binding domain